MAKPLQRYSSSRPGVLLRHLFIFPLSLYLSALVSLWQFAIPNLTLIFTTFCCVCVRHLPCPEWQSEVGGEGVGILISQQKDSPPPSLACCVKDR